MPKQVEKAEKRVEDGAMSRPLQWRLQPVPDISTRSVAASSGSPCTTCGACCAYSDTWPEFSDDDVLDGVPEHMCDCDHGRMKCHGDRCVALLGDIGHAVQCSVYESRPSVCRQFLPATADCNEVRRYFDLSPLIPHASAHLP